MARGPRALRPVENQPTAHGARARWRTWRGCLRSQRATRSIPRRWPRLFFTDTAPGRRLRLRNVVATASEFRVARPARASPRGEQADRPRSTRALADLAWLSLRPTRGALHPTPLAEAPLHRHRARSAAAASRRVITAFELQWRAARARFAPWRTSRPPTEHARAGGLGVVVFAANARRAPSHAVGRGSSSPTPRQVGGCGFETSLPPRPTPWRATRARFAPWRTGRPPTGSTSALADLAWLSLRPTRGALHPHAVGRGSSSPTPRLGRRLRLRDALITAIGSRGARPARASSPWRTGRPPTEHARAGGLGVVVFAANARRAPSHAVGRGSSSPTPRQVGGCGFGTSCSQRSTTVSRGPRALRPVENQPTAHGARARWRTWRGCLRSQRATRSIPRRWPRLFFTDTAPGRRLRLRNVVASASDYRVAQPACASPCGEPGRRPQGARARWRTWRGCLCGQHAARSTPRRWPRLFFTDTAPGRRLRLRNAVITAFKSVARDPRALRPVENQPTAHGARARWRTWRGCLRSQRAARSTPRRWPRLFFTDTAPGRRLRLRNVVTLRSTTVARGPRALRPVENQPTDQGSTRALADLAWLSSQPTRGALHPTPLAEAPLHRHRARSAAAASKRRSLSVRAPWRAARARFAPWRTGRPPKEHARAGGLGVVVFAANTRRAPPPRRWPRLFFTDTAPGRRLRLRTSCNHCIRLQCRATRARFAPWRTSRPPTEHARRWRTWRGCLRSQRATRSIPRRWPRLFFTDTAPGRRLRLQNVDVTASDYRVARPARASPCGEPADRPREHARAGGLGVVVFAANTRRAPPHAVGRGSSSPTPRLGRRLQLRDVVITAIGSSAARPARASPRGEPADRPRSTRALAGLAWLSSQPTRDALDLTPLAEALLHRHCARSTAAASNVDVTASDYRVARPARAAPCGEPADAQGSTRALADLAVVLAANARRAPSHAVGRGSSSPTPCQVDGCGFETSLPPRPTLVCARPACASPRGEQADDQGSTSALADLAWLSLRPTRDALHPTPLAEALLHRHRPRSAAAALR